MASATDDPYRDPSSDVLGNRLGITDAVALQAVEADVSVAVLMRLAVSPLPGNYDLAHPASMHREIFGRVYPWAGEVRTVAIAKTDMFCLPQFIEPYAAAVFGQLADEKLLRHLTRAARFLAASPTSTPR